MPKAKRPHTGNVCETCPAVCCKYLNIIVENPRTPEEVNGLLWYIYHRASELYLDTDGDWSVVFQNPCKHLDKKNRCKIYARRPSICRQFSARDCHGPDFAGSIKLHFKTDREFIGYIKRKRPALFRRLKKKVRALAD